MEKVKVMVSITGLNVGGAENIMLNTINNLDKSKYEIIVCSLLSGTLEKELRKNYNVIVLGMNNIFSIPRAIFAMHKIIKSRGIQIIQSHLFHANFISRLAAIGTSAKVIATVHSTKVDRWWYSFLDGLTSSLVEKYIAVSEGVRDYIMSKSGIPGSKIVVIPNGIDLSRFSNRVNVAKKRAELGLNKSSKVIISVANLREGKDYPTLFTALKIVLNYHAVELLVVGKGESEMVYRKAAENLGISEKVHFLGYRDDVIDLLKSSDVCVLSTLYEGQSVAILEYMASGKPIVTTDIKENRELLRGERDALLVPVKDADAMSGAIIRLLDDKKLTKKLINSALRRVSEYHDLRKMVSHVQRVYEKVLKE